MNEINPSHLDILFVFRIIVEYGLNIEKWTIASEFNSTAPVNMH